MYIPNPFFPNVPRLGDFTMDHIIIDDGYPILFVCHTSMETFYLCLCRTTWKNQKWLLAKVDLDQLEDIGKRKIPIRDAFINSTDDVCVATWSKENPVEKYNFIYTAHLTPKDLPPATLYLNIDYAEDLLDYVTKRKYDQRRSNGKNN